MYATTVAGRTAVQAFVRAYSDPGSDVIMSNWQVRKLSYNLRWAYYNNSIFDDLAKWRMFKGQARLYRHIRPIYNPARRLGDFYAGVIYPGVLTVDAKKLNSGIQIAIPLSEDISPQLKKAIAQQWQWANWQSKKSLYTRYGSVLGDVLIQVVDDLEHRKVYPEIVWPGRVSDLELDSSGNVLMYQLEYELYDDEKKRPYIYKRRVDKEAITTFRDGEPYSYDNVPSTTENIYGFVPAIWAKHTDVGEDRGEPALRNALTMDELNSLASMVLDSDRKILTAPVLVKGKGFNRMVTTRSQQMPTDLLTRPELDQEGINFMQGPVDADFKTLTLPQGDAMARIENLITEVEKNHPELTMYHELRGMNTVSAPGAARLFGDVQIYVQDASANYDTQSIKLFQMLVAIAGYRANSGEWGADLTSQQKVFLPFNLSSYERGELDFSIDPRPLIQPTEQELILTEQMRMGLENQRQANSGESMTQMQMPNKSPTNSNDTQQSQDMMGEKSAIADIRSETAISKI